jgi:hypothetical protein
VILLALAVVPYQFWLSWRLHQLQGEAAAVVAYAYEQKLATGEYPANLAAYAFEDPSLASHFSYTRDSAECAFLVSYYVGTPNTSHSYCPSFGWSYYPD